MFKLGLKNLRRLRSIEPVEIRPITLLVGKNSSGKSSFLRTFPLLRQSTITRSSAPVLWFGALVDFGNFETTVSDNDKQHDIVFSYVIDNLSDNRARQYIQYSPFDGELPTQPLLPYTTSKICVDVSINSNSLSTKLSKIDINIDDLGMTCSITMDRNNKVKDVIVDGVNIGEMLKDTIDVVISYALLPNLSVIKEIAKIRRRIPLISALQEQIHTEITRLMKSALHKRVGDDTRAAYAGALIRMPELSGKHAVAAKSRMNSNSFASYLDQLVGSEPTKEMIQIIRLHKIFRLFSLYFAASDRVSEIFRGVVYIGPARSRSERYYRYQELAVSEIDPDGTNKVESSPGFAGVAVTV